jgi:diaminopimelate epimerase
MMAEFTKMNGAGNDFILMDNRQGTVRLSRDQIIRLCHRQRGIGADGLVLLVPCASGRADWAWDFYNSDGSSAEMCGNASRCFARFIQRLTPVQSQVTFETYAGVITAVFRGDLVEVSMTPPQDLRLGQQVVLSTGLQTIHSLNTGVPHAVLFVPDVDHTLVQPMGAEIRNHTTFAPKGTNVNFVQLTGHSTIRVRTYERGVEGETLACGTGVTAAALISARVHQLLSPVRVRVQGGDCLEVSFTSNHGGFAEVKLTGPAEFVFEGKITL